MAWREVGADVSIIERAISSAIETSEAPFQNGMIAQVMTTGFFDYSELAKKIPVPLQQLRTPLRYDDPNDGL